MMKNSHSKIIFKAPFNNLSFGQVSYNLCKAFFKLKIPVSLFPLNNNVDLGAYDLLDKDFADWIKQSIDNRYKYININTPCLQLWHIRDSDSCITSNSSLFTFHETDKATETELAISSLHKNVIFSSNFSKEVFKNSGLKNCHSVSIGFDEEIKKTSKEYFKDSIHFILVGKWELRKNTELIIKTWIENFGNKDGFRLTCLVENPFFQKEIMSQLINNCLQGKDYYNVTFLPRLGTNSEVNDLYNSADIDLSGLSSAEGWNLPAFNATCLGKWSCVLNHTSHKDWANKDNCILVEPSGKRPVYDGAFFREGEAFSQGNVYSLDKNSLTEVLQKSISFAKNPNPNGEKLKEIFTYENTVKSLLNIIS